MARYTSRAVPTPVDAQRPAASVESPHATRNDELASTAEVRLDPGEVTAIAEGGQAEQPRDLQSRRVRILMDGRR